MQVFNSLADLAGLAPPPVPEPESPAQPRTYDCTGCRFVDSNGLVCGFCLRKILDNQAEKKSRESLMAACFDGHSIKNAIIAEAAKLLPEPTQTAQPSENQQVEPSNVAGDVALGSWRLLGQLSRMIENKINDNPKHVHAESKLMAEIRAKKQEQGIRM